MQEFGRGLKTMVPSGLDDREYRSVSSMQYYYYLICKVNVHFAQVMSLASSRYGICAFYAIRPLASANFCKAVLAKDRKALRAVHTK